MHELPRIFEAAAGPWGAAMLRASIQGGMALGIVWLLCRALTRLAPAWKCWLWRLAYLKLLIAICWSRSLALPVLRPQVADEASQQVIAESPGMSAVIQPAASYAPAGRLPQQSHLGRSSGLPDLPAALLAGWMAGSSVWIVLLARRWRAAGRLRRDAAAVAGPSLLRDYSELAAALSVRGPPPLLTSNHASGPLLVGLLRPAIVLPRQLIGTNAARLRLMLAHELAHVRRRDLPWGLLPMLARILFWFHPLVWLAEREWQLARESACDLIALDATGASAAEYGRTLLEVITAGPGAAYRFAAAGIVESQSTFKRRILAMRYFPFASQRRWKLVGSAAVLGAALAVAPVRLTAHPATGPAADSPQSRAPTTGRTPAAEAGQPASIALPATVEGRTVEIRPQIDAAIREVMCQEGQTVKRGDLLIQLEDGAPLAQLQAAEAELRAAAQNAKRFEQASKGTVALADVREAVTHREVAAAALAVKQAAVEQTRIVAPLSGVVSRCDANPGEVVTRGASLATVVQVDPLKIVFSVPQSYYAMLHVGQDVRIAGGNPAHQYGTGKISFISPELDPSTRSGIVKAEVKNPKGELMPGMFVTVKVPLSSATPDRAK